MPFISYAQYEKDKELTNNELDELVIQIGKINSEWSKPLKKPKYSDWEESMIILPESHQITSQYTPKKKLKFNGVSFLVIAPELKITSVGNKKFKPVIYKITPQKDTLFLSNEQYLETNGTLPTHIIKEKASIFDLIRPRPTFEGFRLNFEFNHIIEIEADETVYIGFEYLRNELTPENISDIVWVGGSKNTGYPQRETKITKSSDPTTTFNALEQEFKTDLYFELKVVK